MSNILVTGASGFVGRNLIPYLEEHGLQVISVSRSFPVQYKDVNETYLDKNGIYAIVHLAGKAHDLKNVSKPEEYFQINTELTQKTFDSFCNSKAAVFIYVSSVKAVVDHLEGILDEHKKPTPTSIYGISKLKAEEYLLSKQLPNNKKVIILRPCMIHGPGNKGNLNLLYRLIKSKIPWLLADFDNLRSMCSIENFNFIIRQILIDHNFKAGVYNVADSLPVSTNHLVRIISECLQYDTKFYRIPKSLIRNFARVGDFLNLPFNTSRLTKVTESFVVSNNKIVTEIGQELPVKSIDGLKRTIFSFKKLENDLSNSYSSS